METELFLTDQQKMIRGMVRRFAREMVAPAAAQIDQEDRFPWELYRKMGDLGLLGLLIPEEAGGEGVDIVTQALVQEELARASASVANAQVTAVEEGLTIYNHASADLRDKYLPDIISGRIVPAFALTEPNAGSDAASIQTTAERDGGIFVINGQKAFITAAGVADVIIVVAITDPSKGKHGISAIVVDRSTPGLTVDQPEDLVGVRGLATAAIRFEGCRVPVSHLIGEEGKGLRISLTTINLGRISTAAMAVGIAQAAFEAALEYAQQRVQFGQRIFEFQAIQFKLARMAMLIDAARLLYLQAARLADQGHRAIREASEAKLFASDMAMEVTGEAVQIFGGNGYSRQFPVERYWRDARICQIYEGTNEIQHLVIARELVR